MPLILATDIIIFLFTAFLIYSAARVNQDGISKRILAEVRTNKLALVCLVILTLYLFVAVLDSIRWRDEVINEDNTVATSESGEIIYNHRALSLIDRIFANQRTNTEKSFSSPLSDTLLSKSTIEHPDGRTTRDYPALKYPGTHLLGTDKVGTDVFFSALKGIRTGITIGIGTTIVVIPFAILFGVVAGYFGGKIDDFIQYIYTTLASIPGILLIVSLILVFAKEGYQGGLVEDRYLIGGVFVVKERLFWLCLIMGVTSWTDLCRLIRGETLKLRELEYVEAARAFGVSSMTIIYKHIVPNLMHLILITFVLQFSGLVLAEAVLSYIGIGVGAEMGSWGNMINATRLELSREPVVWWSLLASFVFMIGLVLPANIFADTVRDALDPRLRKKQ